MNRKGDVFFMQEFVALIVLAVVGVLLFGLFWISSNTFKERVTPSVEGRATELSSLYEGAVLRVYLETRLDESSEKFNHSGLPAANATFAEALTMILDDPACLAAIAAHEPESFSELPAGLCRAFVARTYAFFGVIAEEFLLTVDGASSFTLGGGSGAGGGQALPGMLLSLSMEVADA